MSLRVIALVATVMAVPSAKANIILNSDYRSVDVSGGAGGLDGTQTYSDSQSPPNPFSDFTGSAAGEATWSDTTPEGPNLPPGVYKSNGFSTQNSLVGESSISLSADLFGKIWSTVEDISHDQSSFSAHSIFEIGFSVQTPQRFDLGFSADFHYLTGQVSLSGNWAAPILLSSDGVNALSRARSLEIDGNDADGVTYSGTLDPGAYTLIWDAGFSLSPSPESGSLEYVTYQMDFTTADSAPVPDSAGLGIAGLSALACLAFRRFA